jgi:hypothetical protein
VNTVNDVENCGDKGDVDAVFAVMPEQMLKRTRWTPMVTFGAQVDRHRNASYVRPSHVAKAELFERVPGALRD